MSLQYPETIPYPPLALANRVGSLAEAADPYAYYDELGRRARKDILAALPADWTFAGKRVLDFGCGAGRTLRHFMAEATVAELWGSDIDADSIEWLHRHLSPPLRVLSNAERPPLDCADGTFDLIWSVSVFTHLADTWSDWLIELRRVLKPGGLLVTTFMGEGMSELISGEPWDEDRIGMNVLRYGQSWDEGGPMVLHSPWWIREHWGRAFDVLDLVPLGFATDPPIGQGIVVLRRTEGEITAADLARVEPGDERELAALLHNVEQLRAETGDLRRERDHLRSELAQSRLQLADVSRRLEIITKSRSWMLTGPLRAAGARTRRLRR